MNPFVVNDENKEMVIDNISYVINNFLNNKNSKYVLFNWVIHTDEIMNTILKRIDIINADVFKITLMCEKDELIKRINKDIKIGVRDKGNIKRSIDKYKLYEGMNTIKINTSNRDVSEIVRDIKMIINN